VVVSWLAPSGPLAAVNEGYGFKQDAVIVRGVVIVRTRDAAISISLTALETPDHAVGRLLERAPRADAAQVLREAADSFLAADMRRVADIGFGRGTLTLPAGDGVFLSNIVLGRRRSGGGWTLYCRPRTFVSSDMAAGTQAPLAPASDVERTVLVGGLAMSGKLPWLKSPLSAAEESALIDLAENAEKGHT
jgi:hypothetical protein